MEQKVIEGTWEEVTRRSQELAGHRVRLTVLDELTPPTTAGVSQERQAEEAFKRHLLETGLVSQLPTAPADAAEDDDDAPIAVAGEPVSETILRERR
jgi:hypothetical protein